MFQLYSETSIADSRSWLIVSRKIALKRIHKKKKTEVVINYACLPLLQFHCCLQYIHYNLLVRITTYLLTPLMLCVLILYLAGSTNSLKSFPIDKFLRNFSWLFYLFSEFLPLCCRGDVPEDNAWFGLWTVASYPNWNI